MASLIPVAKQQFTDNNGSPLAGGKVYTYFAGTTTPKPTYTDSTEATQNPNPIILDSRGEAAIFLNGSYKVVLQDANGSLIYSIDNVMATSAVASSAADAAASATSAAASATSASASAASATNSANSATASANSATNSASSATASAGSATSSANSATASAGSAASAAASLVAMTNKWYGALPSDPTHRPDGSACQEGDTYTLSTNGQLRTFHAGAWGSPGVAPSDSSLQNYLPPGVGALLTNVQAKLRQYVAANDFSGVDPTGVSDSTAGLKACFDYAIPLGITVELEGTYLVSGTLQPYAARVSGAVHIRCKGLVTINVSSGSTAFKDLLYFETTGGANTCSISGGAMVVNGNNKCGRGFGFANTSSVQGGSVNIQTPITFTNLMENDVAETRVNYAIQVFGFYDKIRVAHPKLVGLARVNAAGVCQGITMSNITGDVTIDRPHIESVSTPGSTDADGIAVLGYHATTYTETSGSATINEGIFVDCQGRAIKSQMSETVVVRPKIKRKMLVGILNGADVDFQYGNGILIEPDFEYRLNGATSPLGASHACVIFQQMLTDAVMRGKSIGGSLRTEVAVTRYALITQQSTSQYSETEVDDLKIIPIGAIATKCINNAIAETDMGVVQAKTAKTKISVRNCSGQIGCYPVGYTNASSASAAGKFDVEVCDNRNTLGNSGLYTLRQLSGTQVTQVDKFKFRNNENFSDLMFGGWVFDFANLVPGCTFSVDLTSVTATNPPAWGASGYATVECIAQLVSTSAYKCCRVTVGNAAAANTVFYTQSSGVTWGTIK